MLFSNSDVISFENLRESEHKITKLTTKGIYEKKKILKNKSNSLNYIMTNNNKNLKKQFFLGTLYGLTSFFQGLFRFISCMI